MNQRTIRFDTVVFGGGVSGLWIASALSNAGYGCLVLEADKLGSTQTIGSQGIIHGGVKYALSGNASDASQTIAEMPHIWRKCLQGAGQVNLSSVRVLSESQYLWTTRDFASRFVAFAASQVYRTFCHRVTPSELVPFKSTKGRLSVYRVAEQVLDPKSLLHALARQSNAPILKLAGVRWIDDSTIELRHNGESHRIRSDRYILAAGLGNHRLLNILSGRTSPQSRPTVEMQRRPLHMVMVRGRGLPMLYGHCIGATSTPRVTVTSQLDASGRAVWYLGGSLAETGVERDTDQQIQFARQELIDCVEWIDWRTSELEWATCRWNRAEARTESNTRPNGPSVTALGNAVVVWPTKLAFAPRVASLVLDELRRQAVRPKGIADVESVALFPRAEVAALPWEDEETRWN
jgi:glycerol-3-phosphate dehydrogenase